MDDVRAVMDASGTGRAAVFGWGGTGGAPLAALFAASYPDRTSALLLDGQLPATDLGLYISGRAGFEIVQKAWAAGFGAVVAVSAPSALAVEAARRAGITLVGFVRGDPPVANVYSPEVPTA